MALTVTVLLFFRSPSFVISVIILLSVGSCTEQQQLLSFYSNLFSVMLLL